MSWGKLSRASLVLLNLHLAGCSLLLEDDSTESITGKSATGGEGSGGEQTGGMATSGDTEATGGKTTGGDDQETGGMTTGGNTTSGAESGGTTSTGGESASSSSGGGMATGGAMATGGSLATGGDEPSTGGAATGGDEGTGGEMTVTPPVEGVVVDPFGHPVPGVQVAIGDAITSTDELGRFSVAEAGAEYDVELYLMAVRNNSPRDFVWVYQGLTRRDPTLEVIEVGAQRNFTQHATLNYADTSLPANTRVNLGYLGDNGVFSREDLRLGSSSSSGGASAYMFANKTQGWLRALHLEVDPNNHDLPTAYLSEQSVNVAMDSQMGAAYVLDFGTPVPLDSENVAVQVNAPLTAATWDLGDRGFSAHVRYSDGVAVPVLDWRYNAPDQVTVLAPKLSNASMLVAASAGRAWNFTAYSAAYADYVVPGTTDVTLEIPDPPRLVAPKDSEELGPGGEVRYTTTTGGVHDVVVTDQNSSWMRIVTTDTTVVVPESKLGFKRYPVTDYSLRVYVQKHDHYDTVDDATGVPDRLTLWSSYNMPLSGKRGDGTYSISAVAWVNTPAED